MNDKDRVNYILHGRPETPDDELPDPEEEIAGMAKRMAEEKTAESHLKEEEKPVEKWVRARELYDQGLTDGKIGDQIGVSANSVLNWRRKEGLPSNWSAKSPRKKASKPEKPDHAIADQQKPESDMKSGENPDLMTFCGEQYPGDEPAGVSVGELMAMTLQLLLIIWQQIGKEESA